MRRASIFLVAVLSACSAWGQIRPQDQPTLPNQVIRESPASINEPSLHKFKTHEAITLSRLNMRFLKQQSGERRKVIEEDIKARWREIFGVDPTYDKIEIQTGYPDLKKSGIPALPQVTRPLGKRQIIPQVPLSAVAGGPSGGYGVFEDFTMFLVESDTETIFDPKPNQYSLRAFQTFVSMVHSGKLRLADTPSGSRSNLPEEPASRTQSSTPTRDRGFDPFLLQLVKPFSILLDDESRELFRNIPFDPALSGGDWPVLPQLAQAQQPAQEESPIEQQPREYFRPHIAFDPNLHHQVQLRRAMREQAEQDALEAERQAADQAREEAEPDLPMLERGRLAPWPEAQDEVDESVLAIRDETQSHPPAEVLFERGLAAFQGRVYHNAMRAFQQLYEVNFDDLETRFAYGLALFASNRFERASEILPQVIREAERAGVELPAISTFYINERDYRSHRAALERQRALTPGNNTLAELARSLPAIFIFP